MPDSRSNSVDTTPRSVRARIVVRGPYDANWMLSFLRMRAIPELERIDASSYQRRLPAAALPLTVRVAPHALALSMPPESSGTLKMAVRSLFDLDADSTAIDAHLSADPRLRAAVQRSPGLRVPGALDGFELAVRAILGQQVSVARATVLAGLLVRRFGDDGNGGFVFPAAHRLARQTPAEIGLPGRRGDAIRRLAEAVNRGDLEISPAMPATALRRALTGIAGIGTWTAEYVAMRAGRDADAFPDTDWVVLKQLGTTPAGARRAAEMWRPFRAYAVMHLWAAASAAKRRVAA
jgi:AraC family transcriptional regulator of adaptative response / DNA-3-methyladenine glycosylase II